MISVHVINKIIIISIKLQSTSIVLNSTVVCGKEVIEFVELG